MWISWLFPWVAQNVAKATCSPGWENKININIPLKVSTKPMCLVKSMHFMICFVSGVLVLETNYSLELMPNGYTLKDITIFLKMSLCTMNRKIIDKRLQNLEFLSVLYIFFQMFNVQTQFFTVLLKETIVLMIM